MENSGEFLDKCPMHPSEKLKMFCIKDIKFICPECIIEHEGHGLLPPTIILKIPSSQAIIAELEKKKRTYVGLKEKFTGFITSLNEEIVKIDEEINSQNLQAIQKKMQINDSALQHLTQKLKKEHYVELLQVNIASIKEKYKQLIESISKFCKDQCLCIEEQISQLLPLEVKKVIPEKLDIDSAIVKDPTEVKLLKDWLENAQCKFSLLFRASRDGFDGSAFYNKVNGKGPVLIIAKVKDSLKVFGGFANFKCDK